VRQKKDGGQINGFSDILHLSRRNRNNKVNMCASYGVMTLPWQLSSIASNRTDEQRINSLRFTYEPMTQQNTRA